MSIIDVRNLTKDYGFGRGVFDVSFHIDSGEVFGFLGPNGAGKSTTIRHLMGFSKPERGHTQIFGMETFDKYSEFLNRVGYIPGEISLPAGLTGWDFLHMMQDMQKTHNNALLKRLIEMFELDPSGDTKRMSLGVKRKLAVVSAFMNDPEVLILDEPTSGLDPVMQQIFIDYVREEKKRGKTILLSSHIFSEVDATCDRIAIIKDGKIISDFVANDLKHATLKQYRVEFDKSEDMESFRAYLGTCDKISMISAEPESNAIIISTQDAYVNDMILELSKYSIHGFTHLKETLEEYFMKYYKEDKVFGGVLVK